MSEQMIKGLKPSILWQRFYEITQVPRPSKKEEKIIAYLKSLADDLKLSYKEDKVGNLVITVPAAKGFENSPTVVLQGHVDMVCEKNKGTEHDFDKDPISMKLQDGWVTANGTTLGSDNGIGVAAALAIVTDKDAVHGPIEILLTVDEETGLTGANNLQPGFITGKILLNMDSEEDGAFYIGCSGGVDAVGVLKLQYKEADKNHSAYELSISGLKGGHSGLDINTGRANAIKLLGRTLKNIFGFNFSVANIKGGSKRNAIPREAEAVVLFDSKQEKDLSNKLNELQKAFVNEFKQADGAIKISLTKLSETPKKVYVKELSDNIIRLLLALPHGVIAMSQDIAELVETSTNLATVDLVDDYLRIGTSQRSSIESAKKYISSSVVSVFELAGAKVEIGDGYPGWKPNLDSQVLKLSKNVFEKTFNKTPELKAIHAGLECGILGDKYPGLDMISFGPTIQGAHSPDERVNVETVERFYTLLKAILKELAEKN